VQHPADKGRVEEGHVGGADEGYPGVVGHFRQAGGDPLHRAEAFDGIFDHPHAGRQIRELLARGGDHYDWPVHRPAQERRRAIEERGAVPLEGGLRRTHARGAAAGEHDAGCALVAGKHAAGSALVAGKHAADATSKRSGRRRRQMIGERHAVGS